MSKDPAFLFYPGDWLGGTMGMSFEIKGCYMELLIYQFNNGKFTEIEAKQVLSICFDVAWPLLKRKFKFDGETYENERLRDEIKKRSKFTESRRLNGLKPKKEKEAYAKHMENENENENLFIGIGKENKIDFENSKIEMQNAFSLREKLIRLNGISESELEEKITLFFELSECEYPRTWKETEKHILNWMPKNKSLIN